MMLRTKLIAVASAVALLVGATATTASADVLIREGGPLTCGGPTFPTVQYKINVATRTAWYNSAGNGVGGANYPSNVAVYSQANTQGPDKYDTYFLSGHSFSYFTPGCH